MRIIVPLDGSPESESAIAYLRAFEGAHVVLLHVPEWEGRGEYLAGLESHRR